MVSTGFYSNQSQQLEEKRQKYTHAHILSICMSSNLIFNSQKKRSVWSGEIVSRGLRLLRHKLYLTALMCKSLMQTDHKSIIKNTFFVLHHSSSGVLIESGIYHDLLDTKDFRLVLTEMSSCHSFLGDVLTWLLSNTPHNYNW